MNYVYSQIKGKYIKNEKYKLFRIDKYNIGSKYKGILNNSLVIPSFSYTLNMDDMYSEGIMGNLTYFIIANLIVALLLLLINSYFSLSVKYLEKGGGFE